MDKLIKPSNSSISLQKNPATHYSTSDWDFGNLEWELSATQFISAPTSLHFTDGHYEPQLLKQATPSVGPIPQGKLEFHVWAENAGTVAAGRTYPSIFFRHNSPDGEALFAGKYFYMVQLFQDFPRLYRRGSAGNTNLGNLGNPITPGAWQHYRLQWWWSKNALNQDALAVRLDKYVAGAWVEGTVVYDLFENTDNEPYKRIGFGAVDVTASYYDVYFDDCHLYK